MISSQTFQRNSYLSSNLSLHQVLSHLVRSLLMTKQGLLQALVNLDIFRILKITASKQVELFSLEERKVNYRLNCTEPFERPKTF